MVGADGVQRHGLHVRLSLESEMDAVGRSRLRPYNDGSRERKMDAVGRAAARPYNCRGVAARAGTSAPCPYIALKRIWKRSRKRVRVARRGRPARAMRRPLQAAAQMSQPKEVRA